MDLVSGSLSAAPSRVPHYRIFDCYECEVVSLVLATLGRRDPALGRRVLEIGSVGVILAGSYWFIERVFF
jgi:hypothetical protein